MKKLYTIVFALSLGVSLPACSYFETGTASTMPELKTMQPEENVEAVHIPDPVGMSPDYPSSVAHRTNGSVQVFSLDGRAPSAPVPAASESQQQNIVMSMSQQGQRVIRSENPAQAPMPVSQMSSSSGFKPSVEVFPLDRAAVSAPDVRFGAPTSSPFSPVGSPSSEYDAGFPTQNEYVTLRSGQSEPAKIYFGHGSVFLDAEDLATIDRVASVYESGFGADIYVDGHASVRSNLTDETDKHVVNLRISMDRAFAVARALMERGVPADKIKTQAYGDAQQMPMTTGRQ